MDYQNIFTRVQVRGPIYAGVAAKDQGAFQRGETSFFFYWAGKLGNAQIGPFYLGFLGIIDEGHGWALVIGPYVVLIALLMVSRVPTFSGKHMGRIRGDMVLPVLGLAVLAVVMLISYPWEFLSIVSIAYLALIPVSVRAYRKLSTAEPVRSTEPPPAS